MPRIFDNIEAEFASPRWSKRFSFPPRADFLRRLISNLRGWKQIDGLY